MSLKDWTLVQTSPETIALLERAVALHGQGRLVEAGKLYQKLLAQAPENLEALKRLALLQVQAGQPEPAFETATAAQKLRPKSKSVLQTLAVAAMAAARWQVAVKCFEVLTRAEPENATYYWDWGRAEYELNNLTRAITRYHDFLKIVPEQKPEHHFVLGRLYFQNRQPDLAAVALDQALEGGLVTSELLAIRANCYLHEGRQDQAKDFFERALALDQDNVEAQLQYRQLVETRTGDPVFKHLKALEKKDTLKDEQHLVLNFLLGNLYHGIKDYAHAFRYYEKGNELGAGVNEKAGFSYDSDALAAEFSTLKTVFSREALSGLSHAGSTSEQPVFIVGMPRSGTTLLEQIIASHRSVEGRGEVDAMHYIQNECEAALKENTLKNVLAAKGEGWQQRYLDALAPGGATRVTDKLPANFKSLGLITALFPKAKIIHITRNPLDTCVSIYCNMFDTGHPYATGLWSLGDYYRQYRGLMACWQKAIPTPIFEIRYEDLVTHQEKKSREIIAHLGLDWDPACLEFYKTKKAAMTLSAIQVRKPINTSSLGRWRCYQDYLGPLFEGLGAELSAQAKGQN